MVTINPPCEASVEFTLLIISVPFFTAYFPHAQIFVAELCNVFVGAFPIFFFPATERSMPNSPNLEDNMFLLDELAKMLMEEEKVSGACGLL